MRRVWMMLAGGLLLSSLAWGAPCVTGSVSAYTALGASGCGITTPFGTVTFSSFAAAAATAGGADSTPFFSRLILSPFSNLDRVGFRVYFVDGSGNPVNYSVSAGQTMTLTIDYDVSASSPEVISSYSLGLIGGASGTGSLSVAKATTTPVTFFPPVILDSTAPFPFTLAIVFITFGSPVASFHTTDTVTMAGGEGGSATLHDFANIFRDEFPPCPGHTTHFHLPEPGDGHRVLSNHDHAGTHNHIATFSGCPPHAFGHSAGLTPEPEEEGTLLPTLTSAVNQDGTTNSDPSLRPFAQPARRGSVVTLYGPADGFREGDVTEAIVGETPARVLYGGPQQGAPGAWMVQVEVPADALVGPASHVRVISGGREVQSVDIAVN